ncbi:MAG TPA: thioredoxin family protein [Chthoniobacterales bacterium]
MTATLSTGAELGRTAPNFQLPEVTSGELVSLSDLSGGRALLVVFLCRHCPYVIQVKPELARFGADYLPKGVRIAGISANDAQQYPEDAPDRLAEFARDLPFPVLYDEPQDVAKAYRAVCTPDFFLFDGSLRLVYRGQLDDSRPGNAQPPTGRDLRAAVDAVLAGHAVSPDQRASTGCSIKWKAGNEPVYVRS